MTRPTRLYMLMHMDREAAIKLITETYEKHGNWADAARELEVSVPTLRIHARKLGFAPGEHRLREEPPKARKKEKAPKPEAAGAGRGRRRAAK